jgi:hypothetical protein
VRSFILRTAVAAAVGVGCAASALAQTDPMEFFKRYSSATNSSTTTGRPNVVIAIDVANRMQRDAPTDTSDLSHFYSTSSYYDPVLYLRGTNVIAEATLGVTVANTTTNYRRKYVDLAPNSSGSSDKFNADTISVTTDQNPAYASFEARTRLAIAKAAIYQAIVENNRVARFGLIQMRQKNPAVATAGNSGPVTDADPTQSVSGTTEVSSGKWNISRPTVSGTNGGQNASSSTNVLVKSDVSTSNSDIQTLLAKDVRTAGGLLPSGNDDVNTLDAPVNNLLVDAQTEVTRLIGINSDPTCRNTIVVLIVGGGEGNTTNGVDNTTLATTAANFVAISGRRVPIYVIALAPPATDRAGLKAVATTTGGQYIEISKAQIDAAFNLASTVFPTPSALPNNVIVPDVVEAIDRAVAHAFAVSTDFNTFNTVAYPKLSFPFGKLSEYPTVAPITGTVDLTNGRDINNNLLPNTVIYDKASNLIPQRSDMLVTTSVITPTVNGLTGNLRAFRVYQPVVDTTQLSGYKFSADGTRLWTACVPGSTATMDHANGCSTVGGTLVTDPNQRNLYTVDANGNMITFTTGNVATLAPLMNLNPTAASAIITAVRQLPLGAILTSTPAIMNPPSVDPPPDDSYPSFAVANKGRRSIIWVGTNFGILEGIDARLGIEVWGFIPLNLLPKLKTILDGQPIGTFDYFVDSSPKVADVRYPDGTWHTHLVIGEGGGGTFYQSFDVTMSDMTANVTSASDDITQVLGYFSTPRITLNWAFPSYSDFDPTLSAAQHCDTVTGACDSLAYGDIKATAPAVEKSVGQTWSDPAIGQIVGQGGPYSVLVGSGFLPYATEQQANRGGTKAGTTFYILDAKTGTVYTSKDVGNDGLNETGNSANNCRAAASGCVNIKNALQADPVSTGPASSRFITMAYTGDLDGNLWRFDIILNGSNAPLINATTKVYAAGSSQPIFASMATVNVGGTQQYVFFGTGSDLLGPTDKSTNYHLLGILDNGASGSKSLDKTLSKSNGNTITVDERVTAFPAVAGDIVFFTTTTINPSDPCAAPTANLYAFTFIGGPAYDNTGDNAITGADTPLVKSIAGQRATAPFIVDQHLAFAAGGNLQMFGDPNAYNNGVGQAGVRVLSWREVR